MGSYKLILSFLCLTVCFFISSVLAEAETENSIDALQENENGGHDWNELVFTQEWGHSACLQFKERTGGKEACRYEGKPSIWSIHGIWPTETGTSGPNFCSKVKFDESLLDPIMNELNEYWYEISAIKDPKDFWSHEWVKHGSCAKQAEEFSTELKYFQQGLILRNKYDMYTLFKDNSIIPQVTQGYPIQVISSAVTKALGGTPHIQCLHVKEDGKAKYYLLTVEVCLNKDLQVVNCSGHSRTYQQGSLDCPKDELIIYTDNFARKKTDEL